MVIPVIRPPFPIPPVKASSTSGGLIKEVPKEILQLSNNSLVRGTITAQNPNGSFVFSSNQGNLTFSSPLPLAVGNQLVFEIVRQNNQFQARLLSVDGKIIQVPAPTVAASGNKLFTQNPNQPAPQGATPSAAGATPPAPTAQQPTTQHPVFTLAPQANSSPQGQQAQATQTQAQQQAGVQPQAQAASATSQPTQFTPTIFNATLLTPDNAAIDKLFAGTQLIQQPVAPSTQAASPAVTATIPQGSTVQLVFTSILLPEGASLHNPQQAATQQASAQPNIAPSAANSTQPVNPQQIQVPSGATITSTGSLAIQGVVIGNESGEAVIKTPIGTLKVDIAQSLPAGTMLGIEVLSLIPAQPVQTKSTGNDFISHLLKQWGALEQASTEIPKTTGQVVGNNAADNAAKVLQQHMPQASDHTLGAKLMNYIAALKTGDITRWLGKHTLDLLKEAGKGDLAKQIEKDFGAIRQVYNDDTGKSWQTLLFPVYDGEDVFQNHMYIRDHETDSGEEEKKQGVRFVIELDSEAYGELQFDGIVHEGMDKRHFDLIIRSKEHFSHEMQEDIAGIYKAAQEIGGMEGALTFQKVEEFTINPEQENLQQQQEESGDSGSWVV